LDVLRGVNIGPGAAFKGLLFSDFQGEIVQDMKGLLTGGTVIEPLVSS
jgi:hypothetical protein